ncbi:MAG: bifunctional DNA primase/polymerase [Candidatus Nitrosocosmicus sp.]|nr:bifunctional DNA primase/polymerase [Candidatus Nitrosocosmicus sp.]
MTSICDNLDNFYYQMGKNVIPIDSKSKRSLIEWKEWQNKAIQTGTFENWKKKGLFDRGYGIITGKIPRGLHKGKYLVCIDIDNRKALEETLKQFATINTVDKIAQDTLVVQHEDSKDEKAHIYFITEIPLTKRPGIVVGVSASKDKDSGESIPAIEFKTDSSTYMVGPGSIHKNGFRYQIQGTKNIKVLDDQKSLLLDNALDNIYQKYSKTHNKYSSLPGIREMDEDDYRVYGGNNRHLNLLRRIDSWYSASNKVLTFDELLARANNWDNKHCEPPLGENEVSDLVEQSIGWINAHNNSSLNTKNDDSKFNETRKINPRIEPVSIDRESIFDKIPDKKLAEYILSIIQKTVKREDSLIRLILYACLSTYTKDPLNLGLIAPTSEGKTYAVSEVIKLFPKQSVWMIGNMSPKVLIRDKGIMVDQNNEPIIEKVKEIKSQIEKEKDENIRNDLKEQLKALYDNSKVLIDLSNMILVFLEPPHSDTWNILKPILSHDALEMEHPYVYKTETKGLEVKHIVTRGWPACIFCSARDDSSWSVWPEIQSRFFIASPNMVKQKYLDSNVLIAQKKGLPTLVQEQLIISKEDLDLAKDCILLLKEELLANFSKNVWIPFHSLLSESLPSEKGPDVRIAERIFSMLVLVTKVNSFHRPTLVYGEETLAITLLSDLEEVLKLTHNITGIPSYKMDFLTEIFIPLFLSKKEPLQKDDKSEDRIAVYTNELSDYYKERKGKSLTTDAIKKTYLIELKNNGFVDDFQSEVDKRKNGYYPIIDVNQFYSAKEKYGNYTNLFDSDNKLQFFKLRLSNNYNSIDKNWLEFQIFSLINYGIGKTNVFKFLDKENNPTCICQFVREYNKFGLLGRYFQSAENCIYSSKIFGQIIKL